MSKEKGGAEEAENSPQNQSEEPTAVKKFPMWKAVAAACALAVGGASLTNFVIIPKVTESQAREDLQRAANNTAPLRGVKPSVKDYRGEMISKTNAKSKLLEFPSIDSSSPAFVFDNGKKNPGAKTVELYVDFTSQPSRDVILLNQAAINSLVSTGQMRLVIRPVPTKNPISLYSFEALSETFMGNSEKAWPMFVSLLKNSISATTLKSNGEKVDSVVSAARANSLNFIDAASIKNGTFASWIASGAKDGKLQGGYYPPLMFVDGQSVDSRSKNLNDSNVFKQTVMEGK